ncbi:MAG TPA: hypothetical protein VJK26_01025 [Patescibacteria group bacterium]|nr:hypothetical protein [Patescibacteria group bacterium]
MIIVLGLLFFGSILLLFWQASNLISVFLGSPYVRTNRQVIIEALKLSGLKKGEVLYDLGFGNGDVLIEAAKLGAKATGFEISPFYYFLGRIRTWKYPRIQIKYQNIRKADLREAEVIYCYLLPELLEKLSKKFKKELKPSARLISIGFPIKGWTNYQKFKVKKHNIFIYQR